MPTITSITHLLDLYPHLTPRDRHLLALLDEHQVLTTDQIQRLYFQARRTCQLRLRELRTLGLLERFRFARMAGGSEPWHWTLGLAGARFRAGANARPSPTERAHREQVLRLSATAYLPHLLATNEFFVRLRHTARTDPNVSLARWWSERTSTARFLAIKPDGHGLWTSNGRTVGWFLECDRGTESLPRLIAKLDAYERLIHSGGPRYPVLFWLPGVTREANLHQALRHQPSTVPVATATHDADPARAVWLPAGGWQRVALVELPTEHGLNSASNPNWRDGQLDLTDQAELSTSES
jgi:hypothetical protein